MANALPVDAAAPASHADPVLHHYRLTAVAEPGLLPRAVALFAKLGLVPSRCLAVADGAAEPRMTIELAVGGLEEGMADHVAACMRQIYGVEQVLAWRGPGSPG